MVRFKIEVSVSSDQMMVTRVVVVVGWVDYSHNHRVFIHVVSRAMK